MCTASTRTLNQDVLRFVLKNNRVMLQLVSHASVSAPENPMAQALQLSQRDAILAVFPVEAFGKDGAPVIEVTRLFNAEVGDFSARSMLRGGLDSSRSYVEHTKAFPGSVRVDAVHTYSVAAVPMPTMPGLPVMPSMQPARSASLNVAYSIVQLPREPMKPRLLDDRVGYFSVDRTDFGDGVQEARRERVITRWRLEKKDPQAALSEPVKPIVWYIDRATPTALVPYVKKGIEAWNTAFEAAGFKNAVQARPYPTAEEDPEFDPEDVRYSVIRWVPSPIANAYGPHLADPRSGEILNANIVMFHNIVQLQRDWYVTQVGPLDPRARKLPLPDDLMGELVTMVVTHEVGHSLGLPHNLKASSLYPVDKLRDPQWLRTMGHTPSLMDYARFNYVVQPEDGVDPALLIPRIGPYDVFALRWGYTPIPSARTPEEERQQLNLWAREQQATPWLRFSAPKAMGGDFGDNGEAVGDADAVTATSLGLRNLRRVIAMLPDVVPQDGRDDQLLQNLYRATWTQWAREMGHVVAIVGGYDVQNKHNDQPGAIATPVPRERQARRAVPGPAPADHAAMDAGQRRHAAAQPRRAADVAGPGPAQPAAPAAGARAHPAPGGPAGPAWCAGLSAGRSAGRPAPWRVHRAGRRRRHPGAAPQPAAPLRRHADRPARRLQPDRPGRRRGQHPRRTARAQDPDRRGRHAWRPQPPRPSAGPGQQHREGAGPALRSADQPADQPAARHGPPRRRRRLGQRLGCRGLLARPCRPAWPSAPPRSTPDPVARAPAAAPTIRPMKGRGPVLRWRAVCA